MRLMKRSPWRASVCSMRRMSTRSMPMPRIIAGQVCASRRARCAAARHRVPHRRDRRVEPLEQRVADEEMADVELDDLGQRADRLGGEIVEAVARMHLDAEACR